MTDEQTERQHGRVISWFSCGAASAVATKLAIAEYGKVVVPAYCELTGEHPDNMRFIADCEEWFGHKITRLSHPKYSSHWDVCKHRRFLNGPMGAACTSELKVAVRKAFQKPGDRQVFGYTCDEQFRAMRFKERHPDVELLCPLIDRKLTKVDCLALLNKAGIKLPAMYALGYRNNNCIGCVKGGKGYWNKIRTDFPDVFARMSALEESLGHTVLKDCSLRDLPPDAGRYSAEEPEGCGIMCQLASDEILQGGVK